MSEKPRSRTQESGSSSRPPSESIAFNDELHIDYVARLCVIEDLSARFGESVGFLDYVHETFNPDVKPVSRSSNIKSRRRQFKEGKQKLIRLFAEMNNNISISMDIWADCWDVHSYMGVTCHWIDDEFKIQKRLLSFCMLRSHNGKKMFLHCCHVLYLLMTLPRRFFALLLPKILQK
jgi:hypothetical protein